MVQSDDLRREILAMRAALSPCEHRDKSALICESIMRLASFIQAQHLLFFMPFRGEVDIMPLMGVAIAEQKSIYAPRVLMEQKYLRISQINSIEDLERGAYGILEPRGNLPEIDPSCLDLIFVPGSLFDRTGGRKGYGAGYYDRFLLRVSEKALRIAPHFAFQLQDSIEQESHDQRMHILVNEDEVIDTR